MFAYLILFQQKLNFEHLQNKKFSLYFLLNLSISRKKMKLFK